MSQDIAIRKEISFQLLNSNDGYECSVNKRSKINKKISSCKDRRAARASKRQQGTGELQGAVD